MDETFLQYSFESAAEKASSIEHLKPINSGAAGLPAPALAQGSHQMVVSRQSAGDSAPICELNEPEAKANALCCGHNEEDVEEIMKEAALNDMTDCQAERKVIKEKWGRCLLFLTTDLKVRVRVMQNARRNCAEDAHLPLPVPRYLNAKKECAIVHC